MADLAQLISSASKAFNQIGAGQLEIQANTAALEASSKQSAKIQETMGDNASLITSTLGLGQLTMEQSTQRAALTVGADPSDIMGLQAKDAQTLLDAQAKREDALKRVNEKKSIGFFDDPLGWISAQFTINDDINDYNAANDLAGNVEANMAERAKLVDAQYQNNLRTRTTVTAASVQASAENAKNQALLLAEDAKRQAILHNSEGVKTLAGMALQQMQILSNVVDAQTKQQQVQIALDHLELSRQEFDWKKIEKSKGDQASKYVVDTINRGLQVMDPNEPLLDINSSKAIALISGKVPLDGKLKRAFELGEMNSRVDPSGERPVRILGSSPVDFLQTLQYRPAMAPDQKAGVQLIQDTVAQAQDTAQYKALVASKDVEGAKKFLNGAVKEAFADAAKRADDPKSPYALPVIEQILETTPALKQLPFVQNVLAPAIEGKVPLQDPSRVYALGLSAVSEGKISLNQLAVDLSVIYKQAQRINIQSKQLIGMGIAPVEAYNVRIENGDFIDPRVNLADPTEVRRLISKDLASSGTRRRLFD